MSSVISNMIDSVNHVRKGLSQLKIEMCVFYRNTSSLSIQENQSLLSLLLASPFIAGNNNKFGLFYVLKDQIDQLEKITVLLGVFGPGSNSQPETLAPEELKDLILTLNYVNEFPVAQDHTLQEMYNKLVVILSNHSEKVLIIHSFYIRLNLIREKMLNNLNQIIQDLLSMVNILKTHTPAASDHRVIIHSTFSMILMIYLCSPGMPNIFRISLLMQLQTILSINPVVTPLTTGEPTAHQPQTQTHELLTLNKKIQWIKFKQALEKSKNIFHWYPILTSLKEVINSYRYVSNTHTNQTIIATEDIKYLLENIFTRLDVQTIKAYHLNVLSSINVSDLRHTSNNEEFTQILMTAIKALNNKNTIPNNK